MGLVWGAVRWGGGMASGQRLGMQPGTCPGFTCLLFFSLPHLSGLVSPSPRGEAIQEEESPGRGDRGGEGEGRGWGWWRGRQSAGPKPVS